MESQMSEPTRAKDVVRALLDRLPDDCQLEQVIEEILLLAGPWCEPASLPALTEAQRAALADSIQHHRQNPELRRPWREALEKIRQRQ